MITFEKHLPGVTLVTLTGPNYKAEEHRHALDKSSGAIHFGAINHIMLDSVHDIDSWNKAMIYELPKYVHTSHALVIHHDGYVKNPYLWKDEWLRYDWCSSPWPLPADDYSYRSESGKIQRVGNSVSLRSKKLMELAATRPWKSYYGNTNEDGFICCHNREWLEQQGCRFMPFEEALKFGKETELPENEGLDTFMFHSL